MNRAERAFAIFYWVYIIAYIPCFLLFMPSSFFEMLPFHLFGMVIGVPMLVIVFRDLYKRDFPNPNSKVTWAILMLMFWPSIPVYLYKHGFRLRDTRPTTPGRCAESPLGAAGGGSMADA